MNRRLYLYLIRANHTVCIRVYTVRKFGQKIVRVSRRRESYLFLLLHTVRVCVCVCVYTSLRQWICQCERERDSYVSQRERDIHMSVREREIGGATPPVYTCSDSSSDSKKQGEMIEREGGQCIQITMGFHTECTYWLMLTIL